MAADVLQDLAHLVRHGVQVRLSWEGTTGSYVVQLREDDTIVVCTGAELEPTCAEAIRRTRENY